MIGAYSKNIYGVLRTVAELSPGRQAQSLSNDIRSPRSRSMEDLYHLSAYTASMESRQLRPGSGPQMFIMWSNRQNSTASAWFQRPPRFLKPRTPSTAQGLDLIELLITIATHLKWTPSCSLLTLSLEFLKSLRRLLKTRSWDCICARLVIMRYKHEVSYPFRSYTHAQSESDIPYTFLLVLRQTKLTTKLDLRNL